MGKAFRRSRRRKPRVKNARLDTQLASRISDQKPFIAAARGPEWLVTLEDEAGLVSGSPFDFAQLIRSYSLGVRLLPTIDVNGRRHR